MKRAIHNTRRQPALLKVAAWDPEQWSSWQQPDIGHLDFGAEAPKMDPVAATGSSMAQTGALTIGTLATATATKVETIRYYERIGLMPEPARSAGNYRTYGSAHVPASASSGARDTWASPSSRSGRCSTSPTSVIATVQSWTRSRASTSWRSSGRLPIWRRCASSCVPSPIAAREAPLPGAASSRRCRRDRPWSPRIARRPDRARFRGVVRRFDSRSPSCCSAAAWTLAARWPALPWCGHRTCPCGAGADARSAARAGKLLCVGRICRGSR